MNEYDYDDEEDAFAQAKQIKTSVESMRIWVGFLTKNSICCDCEAKGPMYIVLGMGTIVCETCAKLHYQELNNNVRYIYSDWKHEELLELQENGGNEPVNKFLEKHLTYGRPTADEETEDRFFFLVDKYVLQYFTHEHIPQKGIITVVIEREDENKQKSFLNFFVNGNVKINEKYQRKILHGRRVRSSKKIRSDNYVWRNVHNIPFVDFDNDDLIIKQISSRNDSTGTKCLEKKKLNIKNIVYGRDTMFKFKNGENYILTFHLVSQTPEKTKNAKLSQQRAAYRSEYQRKLDEQKRKNFNNYMREQQKLKAEIEKKRLTQKLNKKKIPQKNAKKVHMGRRIQRGQNRGRKVPQNIRRIKVNRVNRKKSTTRREKHKTIEQLMSEVEKEFADFEIDGDLND